MTRTRAEREVMARELGYADYAELVRMSDEAAQRIKETQRWPT